MFTQQTTMVTATQSHSQNEETRQERKERKSYVAPRVVTIGKATDLLRGGYGSLLDSGNNGYFNYR